MLLLSKWSAALLMTALEAAWSGWWADDDTGVEWGVPSGLDDEGSSTWNRKGEGVEWRVKEVYNSKEVWRSM